MSLGSAITAEIAGQAGYDWLLIDMEHGCGDYSDLMHQMQALGASSSGTIVRVPKAEASIFKRVLDMGPAGLMVPNVTSPELARQIVDMARVHPMGNRGVAQTTRASGYGAVYEQYISSVNDGLLIVAQIESRQAMDQIEDIAAVDGIDVLFVGPLDLSIDLGVSHDSPEYLAAIHKVAVVAKSHGKIAGVLVRNDQQATAYRDLGYSFIAMGSDRGQVISGMKQNASFFNRMRSGASHAA
ncbi:HpcH/HpaI aldolase family protein [Allopusillimonas ginsengisoli]|uniref:HpcH/HpaI aldolase family protein n=1 Tax=Allopusillimonas ginsengisoli TaxID=453575 RepID=UPI0014301794|nr:aldolase/citrate lyase family protein [Allopusillimonas ginsengisoli]